MAARVGVSGPDEEVSDCQRHVGRWCRVSAVVGSDRALKTSSFADFPRNVMKLVIDSDLNRSEGTPVVRIETKAYG